MPAPDFEPYKVANAELSSASKFSNFVQAVEDEFSDIDADQIAGYPADATKFLRGDGAWAAFAATFQNYAPTWTASGVAPSLGDGTLTGKYVQIGGLVVARVGWTAGSTTTYGTGTWKFSLPVAAAGSVCGGTAQGNDVGVNLYSMIAVPAGATEFALQTTAVPAGAVGPTVPFTWGSTDTIVATVIYEAA